MRVHHREGVLGPQPETKPEIKEKEETKKEEIVVPQKIKERTFKHISVYYNEKGKIPTIPWISGKIKQSRNNTKNILKSLEEDGFIENKNNRYFMKINIPVTKTQKIKIAVKKNPWIYFIKLLLFIIGIGATYMSIYHSTGFFMEYYSPIKAVLAAIIIICFNILAAELIIIFSRTAHSLICSAFFVLWVLGTIFSMGSTIMGLYNNRRVDQQIITDIQNINNQKSRDIDLKHQNIKEKKEQALILLEGERIKRDELVKLISKYTPEMIEKDKNNYNILNQRRYIADTRIDTAKNLYNNVMEEEKQFLDNNTIIDFTDNQKLPNAYNWLAKIMFKNADPGIIQFWMSVYPAIFYDIIAPVSLSIVFFLPINFQKQVKRRKKRK